MARLLPTSRCEFLGAHGALADGAISNQYPTDDSPKYLHTAVLASLPLLFANHRPFLVLIPHGSQLRLLFLALLLPTPPDSAAAQHKELK